MLARLRAWWRLRRMGTWRRLSLSSGDILVLQHRMVVSEDTLRHIRESVESAIPGVTVLVFDEGLTVAGAIARGHGWPPLPSPPPPPPVVRGSINT
jgi:hypothetical protein